MPVEMPSDCDSDDSVRDPDYNPANISSDEDNGNGYGKKLTMQERLLPISHTAKNKRKREEIEKLKWRRT